MQAFVVRVWEPGDGGERPAALRGVVHHVPTGREVTFASEVELVEFVRASLPAGEEKPPSGREPS